MFINNLFSNKILTSLLRIKDLQTILRIKLDVKPWNYI